MSTFSAGIGAPDQLKLLRAAEQRTGAQAWEQAAGLWAQVVALNPTAGLSWLRLAQARYRQGDYRSAIPAFERALELGSFPDLHEHEYNYRWQLAYDIARCYAQLGEPQPAIAWLERALELGYRDCAAIQNDDALRLLRDDRRFQELVGYVDLGALDRDGGWRHDLAFLAREIARLHYAPFRHVSREEFDSTVRRLHDDIPALTDEQVIVGVLRLMRKLGDGHSRVALWERGEQFPDAPVSFYLFAEGLFVTAAAPEHPDIVGAQVLAFGEHTVERVIAALDPLISRDNAMGVLQHAPLLMRKPHILHALGLIPDPRTLPLTLCNAAGTIRAAFIPAGEGAVPDPLPPEWPAVAAAGPDAALLYLRDDGHYWFEYLPDQQVLYFHYRAVANRSEESFEQFCARLFDHLDAHPVEKLVIDMRRNGGGNTLLHFPLLRGLARSVKLQQHTRLFVIIGRQTFSAAMNGVTFLEHKRLELGLPLIFVGEPTGSSPNFTGETVHITLPYSKLRVSISDLYWQTSWPMDGRTWLAPEIYAPPSFAAYRANRDPALEAILAYRLHET